MTKEEVEAKKELGTRDLSLDMLEGDYQKEEDRIHWDICMPFPFHMCRDMVEKAAYLDVDSIKMLVFPSYELNEKEETLFDTLCAYGKAIGMRDVMFMLHNDANNAADPSDRLRAQVKYLEMVMNRGQEKVATPFVHITLDRSEFEEHDLSIVSGHLGKNGNS